MIKHDRTIIHVEVKDTHEHFYFGSAAAMFEDSRVKNILKIKYQTFRTKRVSADNPYENKYVIVRKGNLNTIDHTALEAFLQEPPDQVGGDARYRQMPRTMLRYAIEKFPEVERQQYLAK